MASTYEISIHALREEGDPECACISDEVTIFLSTPSARRATGHFPEPCFIKPISIHALREEGDLLLPLHFSTAKISIHALREEGDCHRYGLKFYSGEFLSTPSARRATRGESR